MMPYYEVLPDVLDSSSGYFSSGADQTPSLWGNEAADTFPTLSDSQTDVAIDNASSDSYNEFIADNDSMYGTDLSYSVQELMKGIELTTSLGSMGDMFKLGDSAIKTTDERATETVQKTEKSILEEAGDAAKNAGVKLWEQVGKVSPDTWAKLAFAGIGNIGAGKTKEKELALYQQRIDTEKQAQAFKEKKYADSQVTKPLNVGLQVKEGLINQAMKPTYMGYNKA
jgi:hypothetical protein